MLARYLRQLPVAKMILWCYLLWYLVVFVFYFDPNPRIWLTSIGLAGIVGWALYLSATATSSGKIRLERWQLIRLFIMPFCVSSFSALVKGRNFILIFSSNPAVVLWQCLLCAAFVILVLTLKRQRR